MTYYRLVCVFSLFLYVLNYLSLSLLYTYYVYNTLTKQQQKGTCNFLRSTCKNPKTKQTRTQSSCSTALLNKVLTTTSSVIQMHLQIILHKIKTIIHCIVTSWWSCTIHHRSSIHSTSTSHHHWMSSHPPHRTNA